MKHLKWIALPLWAGAVSLAAWSPVHAQGEDHHVYSVHVEGAGKWLGGEDWVDSVFQNGVVYQVNLKPGVPHALVCTATPWGKARPPEFVPLVGHLRISEGSIVLDSASWNAITGDYSPVPFDLICVKRDDS